MTVLKPKKRLIAKVKCNGTDCNAQNKTMIEDVTDCTVADGMIGEDSNACSYGCLGYGSCVEVCPFDAIEIIDGIAVVIKDKCKGCRKCVAVCPRQVISMVPNDQEVFVECNSNDFGKSAKEKCKVACIGCQMCVKACPFFAMDFVDKLATINYDNCTNCGICSDKCPTSAISPKFEPRKKAYISEDKCIGCTLCSQVCPVAAIEGIRDDIHNVNVDLCIGCNLCMKRCPVDAIDMVDKSEASNLSKSSSYQKELIKYFNSFDEIKNADEEIEYGEDYNSKYYKGTLALSDVSKLKHSDIFMVTYRGDLYSSNN